MNGLRQEHILEARHFGYEDWTKHAGYALSTLAMKTPQQGKAFQTDDDRILDLMAHTRQTMRVSYEEWEASVLLTPKPAAEG